MCLEGGAGASSQSARYLVYKLPVESALIGTECKLFPSRVFIEMGTHRVVQVSFV